jgi:hypothetical protein
MSRGKRRLPALVLGLSCLVAVVPASAAAAPSNDNLGSPKALSGLPINATGSNVDATPEPGELNGAFEQPAGHSVWFSWEAESTGWVTVGTCGSDFGSLVDVYTGSSYATLARVPGSNEGPDEDCFPAGSEATIHAVAGTTYSIRVDGNLSPMAPAPKEGTFALEIAPTPLPANDAFAAARAVTAESSEGGTFYRVDVSGFNWNATKEPGEPAHAGDQGGASVWYSWTAPASGRAHVGVGSAAFESQPGIPDGGRLGAYTGSSLGGLIPVGTPGRYLHEVDLDVSAGAVYRFAVDGRFDSLTGMPLMGRFTFLIYLNVPPAEKSGPSLPPIDATAPETTIFKRSLRPGKRSVTLAFRSTERLGGFLCKLDGRKPAKCGSPKTFAALAAGAHTVRVRAVDTAGNADPTPAIARFAIPRQQRRHR